MATLRLRGARLRGRIGGAVSGTVSFGANQTVRNLAGNAVASAIGSASLVGSVGLSGAATAAAQATAALLRGIQLAAAANAGAQASASISVQQQADDWAARSTAAGVRWAHDFTESVNELNYFVRGSNAAGATVSNPNPSVQPNPLTLVPSGLGTSMAIRSRMIGAAFTQATPSGVADDSHVVHVTDAARFPDPAALGVASYHVLIGHPDGACHERCDLTARDTVNNTLTITRRVTSESMPDVEGVPYPYPAAPSYPANGWTIGIAPNGSWNRPFASFPAGQNGKSADDIGLDNGAARFERVWTTTQDGSAHLNFREAYFGSRWYWDPLVNPSAPYVNWTPPAGGGTRTNAFEGDEFYLQFRLKLNAARVGQSRRKMFFLQNAATSGTGQIFMLGGEKKYNEQPLPAEALPIAYGTFPHLLAGGGDGRQPAGGLLFSSGQYDGYNDPDGNTVWQTDYPLGYYNNRLDADCYMFCYPADTWVTFLLHVKFGRDNAEALHPDGGLITAPFLAASDASYRTTVELKVHMQGWADYKTLSSANQLAWIFGDEIGFHGYLFYNAPGENTIWLAENPNMYIGAGSSGPVPELCDVEYTQVILSNNPIPPPLTANVLQGSATAGAVASASLSVGVADVTYTYDVARDTMTDLWRWQSLGRLTDPNKFVLRGVGDHGHYQDNSIRVFDATTGVTTTLESYDGPGNRSPFTQYDNHPTALLPAAMTGSEDMLFWPSIGVYRLGSTNNWTHAKVKLRAGDCSYAMQSISATNPAVVTFTTVSNAGKFKPASGDPLLGMYIYHPGCSLHDTLWTDVVVDGANTQVTLPGLNGATVTGFSPGVGLAEACTPGTRLLSDIFDGPRSNDFIKDETSGGRFTGQSIPYNSWHAYWPNQNKYIWVCGGAGSFGPISSNYTWRVEANPDYPATESWPFRIVNWPFALQNTGPSAWEVRSEGRNGCAIIGDWIYVAGGGVGTDENRIPVYKFHRIRLTDGWVQRLQDLPQPISAFLGAMSYDSKRHRLVWTSSRALAFDVDSIVDINSLGDPWVDLFPGGVYPAGAYHGLDGHDCKYVLSLDKHFIRNGTEDVLGAGPASYWSTLQLPTSWIVE